MRELFDNFPTYYLPQSAQIDVERLGEMMKNLVFLGAVTALVSACGGGGGGGGGGNNGSGGGTAPTQVNHLAAYVGTWAAECDSHVIDNATITSPSNNTLKITTRTDYYDGANCTGVIVATETDGADVTASYVETVDASIPLTPGAAATAVKVDKIMASMPQGTRSVTGSRVTRVVQGGQPQWCISFSNGDQTCVWDEGTIPARSTTGGLYTQGNFLYELVLNGSTYSVNSRYSKK